jgi:threonine/homoserine/homoserine lactone efflux protein
MSPGPNGALILKTVSTLGRKHGFMNVFGSFTAFYFHGTFSIFGLSAILVSSAKLFFIIKMVGAVYLGYLGLKAFYSAFNQPKKSNIVVQDKRLLVPQKYWSCFMEGFLTNLLNPKVTVFYLAAFPQFVPFEESAVAVSYSLVTIHAVFNAIWFSSMVFVVGKTASFFKTSKAHVILQSVTGTVLLWFSYGIASFNVK